MKMFIRNKLLLIDMVNQTQIMDELKSIKKDILFIKKHMVDVDSILTEEDYLALQAYKKEKKVGILTSHEALKKELGL
jgi:hypothetical protein